MKITRLSIITTLLFAATALTTQAQDKVPQQFQGDWVPATAA